MINSNRLKEHETYWLNFFSDEIPLLNLPTDTRREKQGFQGQGATTGKFVVYEGYGLHPEMLQGEYLKKNAEIIKGILAGV